MVNTQTIPSSAPAQDPIARDFRRQLSILEVYDYSSVPGKVVQPALIG
jgi:hypothetical protein